MPIIWIDLDLKNQIWIEKARSTWEIEREEEVPQRREDSLKPLLLTLGLGEEGRDPSRLEAEPMRKRRRREYSKRLREKKMRDTQQQEVMTIESSPTLSFFVSTKKKLSFFSYQFFSLFDHFTSVTSARQRLGAFPLICIVR